MVTKADVAEVCAVIAVALAPFAAAGILPTPYDKVLLAVEGMFAAVAGFLGVSVTKAVSRGQKL